MQKMKKKIRTPMSVGIVRGVLLASGISILSILGFAFVLTKMEITDSGIAVINQVLKVCSILLGTLAAVGRGGREGYLKGALTGAGYMVMGLGMSALSSGSLPGILSAFSELAFGSAVGALCGMLASNLPGKVKSV